MNKFWKYEKQVFAVGLADARAFARSHLAGSLLAFIGSIFAIPILGYFGFDESRELVAQIAYGVLGPIVLVVCAFTFFWVRAAHEINASQDSKTMVLQERLEKIDQQLIEIRFDPTNANDRFWSVEQWGHNETQVRGTEYRIEVTNRSQRTINDVEVLAEFFGIYAPGPDATCRFKRTDQPTATLHPNAPELVKVFLLPGHLEVRRVQQTANPRFSVTFKVRGRDAPEVRKTFGYDHDQVPALTEQVTR